VVSELDHNDRGLKVCNEHKMIVLVVSLHR
jgi:hypothetical protein